MSPPSSPRKLLLKEIPGSYGTSFFTPIKDRLGFYYHPDGPDGFFQSKVDQYNSTVFRSNMPPGPFMASDPRCVVLLDSKSFPVLMDNAKVEKKDVLTGTYMPSLSLTGGIRPCAYLDPSEDTHATVKKLLLSLVASRKDHVVPEFHAAFSSLFDEMEAGIAKDKMADFNALNDKWDLEFFCRAFFGVSPSSTSLGTTGPDKVNKWLLFQLCPLLSIGLPKFLEEIFLHTFPLPTFLVKSDYNDLYKFFASAASNFLDGAGDIGIPKEDIVHNLLFATCFNAHGGCKLFFPSILNFLSKSDPTLHARLAEEIRAEVAAEGGRVTVAAVERMELTKSFVYEALRIDPPIKFFYGHAREDLVVESHEAAFEVKKGEMLFGYQPFASKDERVFAKGKEFVADRFVGETGRRMVGKVIWSNGPETESSTVANKQCPGKDLVVLLGRLLLVEFFLRYDTFTAEVGKILFGAQVNVTSVTKATTGIDVI